MKTLLLLLTLSTVSANAFYIDLTSLPKGQLIQGKMAKLLHKFLPPQSYLIVGNDAIASQLNAKHFKGMKVKIGNEVLVLKCSSAKVYSYLDRASNTHITYSKDITKCQLVEFNGKYYGKQYSLAQLASLANSANSFNVKLPYHYKISKFPILNKTKSKYPKDWDKCWQKASIDDC